MSRQTACGTASVTLLAATFGVSRQAVYAARAASARAGAAVAPAPAVPAPRGVPASVVLEQIHAVVADQPAWGTRKVWATLRRAGLRVGLRRVHALMRAAGIVLARAADERRSPPPRGHVVTTFANRRIAVDFSTVWTAGDGLVAGAIGVDCGCRTVLDVTETKAQTSAAILAGADRALEAAFGSPDAVPDGVELRSDHGPQYTGHDADARARAGRDADLRARGSAHRKCGRRADDPHKEECIWLADWPDAEALAGALRAWANAFNQRRPHQAFDWQTPAARREALLGSVPRKAA